jgi:hypothetical protein
MARHSSNNSLSTSFQRSYLFLSPYFLCAFNSTPNQTVTRKRDTSATKKSLPALVSPITLPNKVAAQRQLSRENPR